MIDLSIEGLKDLCAIKKQDDKLAADIAVRIEEAAGDQNVIQNLLTNWYEDIGRFNIRIYKKAKEERLFIYRIRFFKKSPEEHPGINDYRVFYFWNPGTKSYIVLAIERKYINKKVDHPYDDPKFVTELKERYDANFTT